MTISTTPPIRPSTERSRPVRGFTLVEVIIGSTLASFVLAGVLSSFLMLGRSGMTIVSYSEMEAQIRRSLETLSQDLRMANDVKWNSDASITLTVPDNYASASPVNTVTYAYDAAARTFYQLPGDTTSTAMRQILLRHITAFSFARYNRLDAPTTTNGETKQIQVNFTAVNTRETLVRSSEAAVSASLVLRNKVAN